MSSHNDLRWLARRSFDSLDEYLEDEYASGEEGVGGEAERGTGERGFSSN
jgi:hypothetical protein